MEVFDYISIMVFYPTYGNPKEGFLNGIDGLAAMINSLAELFGAWLEALILRTVYTFMCIYMHFYPFIGICSYFFRQLRMPSISKTFLIRPHFLAR